MKYADINKQKERKEKKPSGVTPKFFVFLGIVIIFFSIITAFALKGRFKPISIIASVTAAELKETDGRTNILVLGSDKRKTGSEQNHSILTDTILVASIGKIDKDVVLISIPRDLWVELPSGGYEKINAVYAFEGADGISKVVEKVLGIPIHYHTLVSFEMFEEVINTLGGVEVNVENSFADYYYPIEGKENAPENERYEVIRFVQGAQKMDGTTALKFVRSRKGDNNEGTDFARARRQQAVISAIRGKATSLSTLLNPIKLKSLYDTYSKNVDTNIDFRTVENFYLLSQQIDFQKIVSIVLDDRSEADQGGLLYAPEDTKLYGGRYVLVPKTGDYSQIHAYVQKYLFGNK
jgi:polyisoprenyl-teichoic acid--peptidoglycan teichoic acid transferase